MDQKRLTRRSFLQSSAVLGTGALLAACVPAPDAVPQAGVEAPAAEAAAGAPAADVTTISYWSPISPSGGAGEAIQQLVDEFNAGQGDVQVELTYVPMSGQTQLSEKLMTSIAAADPPDSAYFDRFLTATWAEEDSFTDLTDLAAASGVTAEQYYPFAWTEAVYKDKLWGIPFQTGVRAFYWRKDLFEEAGLDPETPPVYIDELDAMAEKLFKVEGPRMMQMGFVPWLFQGFIYTYGWAWDAHFYNPETLEVTVNEPRVVAATEWLGSYAQKYDVTAVESFSQAFGQEAQDPFIAGLLAMKVDGTWVANDMERFGPDVPYGASVIPYPRDGGRQASWAGGFALVMPRGAKNVDATWQWFMHMNKPESEILYCTMAGQLPVRPEAAKDPWFNRDEVRSLYVDLLAFSDSRPPLPVGQLLWNGLNDVRDAVIHDKSTAQEALDKLNEEANAELQKALAA